MKKDYEVRQSRTTTHFKFYSEKYLWGSTRQQLEPDERSVWLDFLCLATMNYGDVEIYSRDQVAQQLLISQELLDRSIDKFIKYKKVESHCNKDEEKEIYSIVKWNLYQAEYLTKRDKRAKSSQNEHGNAKEGKHDTENTPTLNNTKEDNTKLQNTTSNKTTQKKTIQN
ncbi:MAG: hypothetical protein ACOC5T_06030 [Elusimicrobiota bacterium]